MTKAYHELSSEEIFGKLLPTFFWEEVATRYPNIPATKWKLFQDFSIVEPFVEQINRHQRHLYTFTNQLVNQLPLSEQQMLKQHLKEAFPKHMAGFIDTLALKCQHNLRSYFQAQYAPSLESKAVTLTDESIAPFINQNTLAVVHFWAAWCDPCKTLAPTINQLMDLYPKQLAVGKVNVDNHPGLGQIYHVLNIPTILFFKNGIPQKRVVGTHALEDFKKILSTLI